MTAELQQSESGRQEFLDVIKGFCIICVIATHFSWSQQERLLYLFPFWIDMAVPVFMIISGYVYALSYKRHNVERLKDAYTIENMLNKIVRYTIPFAIVFLAEIIHNYVMGWGSYQGRNLFRTAVSFGLDFLRGGYGPGSYYYPVMMQFIFVFPVLFFIVRKYRERGVILCGAINMCYELLQRLFGMSESWYRLLVFRYILLIGVGCYMAGGDYKISKIKALLISAVGISFIMANGYLGYSPLILIYWTRTSWLACLYIIPAAMFAFSRMRNVKCKPLEILGKASYEIFLMQMAGFYFGTGYISALTDSRGVRLIAHIVFFSCIGVAFYCIEDPVTRKINRLLYKFIDRITVKV